MRRNGRLKIRVSSPRSQSCSVDNLGQTQLGTAGSLDNKKSLVIFRKGITKAEGKMAIYLELGLLLVKNRELIY